MQLFGSSSLRTAAPRAVDAAKGHVKGPGLGCPPSTPPSSAAVQASSGVTQGLRGMTRASMASRIC